MHPRSTKFICYCNKTVINLCQCILWRSMSPIEYQLLNGTVRIKNCSAWQKFLVSWRNLYHCIDHLTPSRWAKFAKLALVCLWNPVTFDLEALMFKFLWDFLCLEYVATFSDYCIWTMESRYMHWHMYGTLWCRLWNFVVPYILAYMATSHITRPPKLDLKSVI